MDIEKHLSRTHLFENISNDNRSALANICLPKTLRKKEILFLEGDKGYSLYLLISGNIQLFKTTLEGKEIVIRVIKPGELFAEVVLFEQDEYPVSAIALKNSTVYLLPKNQFYCLLQEENFRNEFITILMKKMRYLTDQIRYLTSHDVEDRLLMFFEDQFGRKGRITSPLSKKAVAAAIGATPETLSRLLLRLKNEKKLTWDGSTITIHPNVWQNWERF